MQPSRRSRTALCSAVAARPASSRSRRGRAASPARCSCVKAQLPRAVSATSDQRRGVERPAGSGLGVQDAQHLGGVIEQVQQAVAGHGRERASAKRKVKQIGLNEADPGRIVAVQALGGAGEHAQGPGNGRAGPAGAPRP